METADPVAGPSASTADSAAVVRLLQRRGPRDHQAECRRFDQSDHLGWGCTACRDRPVLQLYRYSRAGGVRIDGDLPCSLGTYRREPGGGHGWTASTGYRRTDYRSGDGEPALSRQWRPAQWSGTSGGDLDPWTPGDEGVLSGTGADRHNPQGWLAENRRYRHDDLQRLPQDSRALQGDHCPLQW